MNLLTKQEETHRLRKQTNVVAQGEGQEKGIFRELRWTEHTATFKIDNQLGPTV